MHRTHATKVTAVLILAAAVTGSAQTNFQGSGNLLLGFPQGKFKENAASIGGAAGFDFAYSPATSPFGVGAAIGFIIYGSETRREIVKTSVADFPVDVSTTNAIIQAHLIARVQHKGGPVRPYLEAAFGLNHLTTDTSIREVDGWHSGDDNDEISTNNMSDTALSYGGGAGIMVKVYEGRKESKKGKQGIYNLLVDSRIRYMVGGQARYLKKGSIRRVDDTLVYDTKESTTDLLTVQLGVTVEF
ncbi:MAG: hypothetical protein ONB17_01770 [candidate division KSB1 bacterium]|nr:hypothetical protein [candidate division KSB1 bacterium]MDZ7295770.1 hypothetical protein [candidate division KSB1 bacterium]MDZ7378246.1 hypothetical protein [candidate division KSB1 bacterium]MDZ7393865.1 hypothetical protein [candidate division KSB1 bacterium]MDZ7412171.1 hypothetical protein [candidate division KSB1 bacterium]